MRSKKDRVLRGAGPGNAFGEGRFRLLKIPLCHGNHAEVKKRKDQGHFLISSSSQSERLRDQLPRLLNLAFLESDPAEGHETKRKVSAVILFLAKIIGTVSQNLF